MANKHIKMLKVFYKVMIGDKTQIEMILPDMYVKDIFSIDYDYLMENKLTNIIFDIDNTIMPVDDIKVSEELIDLIFKLKNDFNICLVSNNDEKRVLPVASALNVEYLADAKKPLPISFDQALEKLKSHKGNTIMVGDQMLSDIKGSNEYGLYSILVEPISKKQNIQTGTSRFLQNIMVKKLSKNNIFTLNEYYKRRG